MSATNSDRQAWPAELQLVEQVAAMARQLARPSSQHREALFEVGLLLAAWRAGTMDEEQTRIAVADVASRGFLAATDLDQPECWMLGLVCSVLGSCTVLELSGSAAATSPGSELAAAMAAQLVGLCAQVARRRPDGLPLGVSPKLYRLVAEDVARRIESVGSTAMHRTFSNGGPLQ